MADASTHVAEGWTRRQVLGRAVALALVLAADPLGTVTAVADRAGDDADAVTAMLRAYVSTLVPGPGDDPAGTPGAVEAGAVEQLRVHVPYVIPPLLADLSGAAMARHRKPFVDLDYEEREALLVEAFATDGRAPYHLIALAIGAGAFYADFETDVGRRHLGIPGPSTGHLATYTDRTGHGQPQRDAVPD